MPASLHDTFRKNVRRRMGELGIKQRALADRMRVSEAYISQMLNANHVPTLTLVERVALAMGTTALYLLTPADSEESEKILDSGVVST